MTMSAVGGHGQTSVLVGAGSSVVVVAGGDVVVGGGGCVVVVGGVDRCVVVGARVAGGAVVSVGWVAMVVVGVGGCDVVVVSVWRVVVVVGTVVSGVAGLSACWGFVVVPQPMRSSPKVIAIAESCCAFMGGPFLTCSACRWVQQRWTALFGDVFIVGVGILGVCFGTLMGCSSDGVHGFFLAV
jgi:hypothetical protein